MDYLAVNEYLLPIELLMENAGLHLARLVTHILPTPGKVLIGVGPGNNGGGGLVAARRLAAWGYKVDLDLPLQTGFDKGSGETIFHPDKWTLAL